MIKIFDDLDYAITFLENEAEQARVKNQPIKIELIQTWDGRWRCGISYSLQLELDV